MKSRRPSKNQRTHILISNKLKFIREDKELTQSDIAEAVNIARGTYASFECGACLPHQKVLDEMVRFFGCEPNDIYADLYLGIIKVESE